MKYGAPKPDISSPDAFKRVLLDAKSIAYISGGRSGPHFISVTERLGIADEVKAKAKTRPSGEAAALVASGEAEVAIQQVPELAAVTGVDVVGPIPSALQSMTELMAAASSSTKDTATARAFLQFLRSADAKTILKARSFEPE